MNTSNDIESSFCSESRNEGKCVWYEVVGRALVGRARVVDNSNAIGDHECDRSTAHAWNNALTMLTLISKRLWWVVKKLWLRVCDQQQINMMTDGDIDNTVRTCDRDKEQDDQNKPESRRYFSRECMLGRTRRDIMIWLTLIESWCEYRGDRWLGGRNLGEEIWVREFGWGFLGGEERGRFLVRGRRVAAYKEFGLWGVVTLRVRPAVLAQAQPRNLPLLPFPGGNNNKAFLFHHINVFILYCLYK